MLRQAASWIAHTGASRWLGAHDWMIPLSQTVHLLALSVLFGAAMLLNLRLLGLTRSGRGVAEVAGAHLPWMWRALAVLLATGLLQLTAEPLRQLVTPAFWWKMALIPVAAGATALYAPRLRALAIAGPSASPAAAMPAGARAFALASTLLWLAIIFCGRFIGYTWADHA